ncbi:hypothetical protein B0H14DRAFT_2621912 [Mycena olivaceomarginata]|nr:hypothetical protein B0H14DRAFT_2621912 [Mycena olivaceomarginata]
MWLYDPKWLNYDVRKLITTSDAGIQFMTMVKGLNKEELKHLFGAFVELAKHNDIHALIAEGITLTSVEGLTNWLLEEKARKCIEALAQHNDLRTAIFTPETVQVIVPMLGEPDSDLRQSARDIIIALAQRDDLRTRIFTPETAQKIVSILGNSIHYVGQSAQETIIATPDFEADDLRTGIVTSETLVTMLENSWPFVENTIIALAQYGEGFTFTQPNDVRTAIFTPQILQGIFSALAHSSPYMHGPAQRTIIALAQYAGFPTRRPAHDEFHIWDFSKNGRDGRQWWLLSVSEGWRCQIVGRKWQARTMDSKSIRVLPANRIYPQAALEGSERRDAAPQLPLEVIFFMDFNKNNTVKAALATPILQSKVEILQ